MNEKAELRPAEFRSTGLEISFSHDKIQLLKETVAKGATDTELEHFIYLAQRYNLDPFSNEIWFIKRAKKQKINGQWDYPRLQNGDIDYRNAETTIMTSRDGYLKIGQSDPNFQELNSMEIRANDDFCYNPMTKEIQHNIRANRGAITGAWAICKRKDREPAVIIVDFNEYKNAVGKSSTWDKYPSAMIRKVAEVIVLKRQFNISGLVTREEMSANYDLGYEEPQRERKDITPQAPAIEENPPAAAAPNVINMEERQQEKQLQNDYDVEWKKYSRKLREKREMLGIKSDQAAILFTESLKLDKDPKNWSLTDLKGAYNFLIDISKPATYGMDKEDAAGIDVAFPLPKSGLELYPSLTKTN